VHCVQDVEAPAFTFELQHDSEMIAEDTGINVALVQEMMVFMVDLGLFEGDINGTITCLKLLKRINLSQGGSPAWRKGLKEAKQRLQLVHKP
jgi:hypothetical protein